MKILKKILKIIVVIVMIPISYILVSLALTAITVNDYASASDADNSIFISTNGVHLDIILPIENLDLKLVEGLNVEDAEYVSFGWGDENFYLNTPTWGDLTLNNAFGALFLNSKSLIHMTRYRNRRTKWTEVKLTAQQLKAINSYIFNSFKLNSDSSKMVLNGKGYSTDDDFYQAVGSYSCFKTCNSWVNSAFKESNLKSCYWTPFDFGLINKHKL